MSNTKGAQGPNTSKSTLPMGIPTEGINLAAKYPKFAPGDVRKMKGKEAPPLYGTLLGWIELPRTIKDEQGELRAWNGLVLELKYPAPAIDPDDDDQTEHLYEPGTRIILTETTVLERFRAVSQQTDKVFDVVIRLVADQTREGRALWNVKEFRVVKGYAREAKHNVALPGMSLTAPRLTQGNGHAASSSEHSPVDFS